MAKGVGVGFECKHDQPYFSFPTPLILPSPCSGGIYSPELSAGGRSGCKLGGSHTYCPFQNFMPIRASPGVLNTHCNHQPIKCNPLLLQCPLNAPPLLLHCPARSSPSQSARRRPRVGGTQEASPHAHNALHSPIHAQPPNLRGSCSLHGLAQQQHSRSRTDVTITGNGEGGDPS